MPLAKTVAAFKVLGTQSSEFVRDREGWSKARQQKIRVLMRLSEEALQQFEDSIIFGKKSGCLLSGNCEKISYELGDDISSFFKLFGIDPTILGYFYPYKCTAGIVFNQKKNLATVVIENNKSAYSLLVGHNIGLGNLIKVYA
jgi:hypothetical protein